MEMTTEERTQAIATLKAMLEKENVYYDSTAKEIESLDQHLSEISRSIVALTLAIVTLESAPEPDPPPIEPVPVPAPSRLGVGYDDNGWTKFESNNYAIVRADGTADYSTLTEAYAAIANDRTIDCLLIDGPVTFSGQWNLDGASPQRPIVLLGRKDAQITGLWSNKPFNNLAIVNTDLIGTSFNHPGENLLIERVTVKDHDGDGLVIQSRIDQKWKNVVLRFLKSVNNWRADGKAQGLYMTGLADDWLMEYCVFHGNGWDSSMPRQESQPAGGAQLLSHNVYIGQPSGPGVARYNIFSAPASHGIHMRSGGLLEHNLFLNCPISYQFGYHYPSDNGPDFGPVGGLIQNNVAIGSDDIRSNPRGVFGILSHVKGLKMKSNYAIANQTSSTNNLLLWFDRARFDQATFEDVEIEGLHSYGWSPNFRDLPASGVKLIDTPSIHELDDLHDKEGLLVYQQADYIDWLIKASHQTRTEFEEIMGDHDEEGSVWGCISEQD